MTSGSGGLRTRFYYRVNLYLNVVRLMEFNCLDTSFFFIGKWFWGSWSVQMTLHGIFHFLIILIT